MSTLSYLKRLVDLLEIQCDKLQAELNKYTRAYTATFIEDRKVPEGTVYGFPDQPLWVDDVLFIRGVYYRVSSINRTEESVTIRAIHK